MVSKNMEQAIKQVVKDMTERETAVTVVALAALALIEQGDKDLADGLRGAMKILGVTADELNSVSDYVGLLVQRNREDVESQKKQQ
jgi:hypothetical protein